MMFGKIINSVFKKKIYFFIGIFVLLMIGISLGSSILTKTITIGGKTKIRSNWIIYFDHVVLNNSSAHNEDSDKDAKIVDFEKQNIEFSTNLSSVGDFYEFDVYTVNDGNVDAMIDSVEFTGTEGYEEYVSYDVKYDDSNITSNDVYYSNKYVGDSVYSPYNRVNKNLIKCDELFAHTRRKIKVRVSLIKAIDEDSLQLNFKFKINYVQYDDTTCNAEVHTLTIDPNGGRYKGSNNATTINLIKDGQYGPLIAANSNSENLEFDGWEVVEPSSNGTYSFVNNLFIMGSEDVTIRAKWKEVTKDFVARIMGTYYETIQDAFDAIKRGEWRKSSDSQDATDNTIHLLKNTSEIAVNEATDSFIFDLGGFTVTGLEYDAHSSDASYTKHIIVKDINGNNKEKIIGGTIINMSGGNISLVNGKIKSFNNNNEDLIDCGVLNYGIFSLGLNDDNVEVQNSITIEGNKYGVYNTSTSTFRFYDGYIDAVNTSSDSGIAYYIEKDKLDPERRRVYTPTEYSIFIDHLENGQRAYITADPNRAVAKTQFDGEGSANYYYNLQDAIGTVIDKKNSPENNQDDEIDYTIYAIRNFDANYDINVPVDSDITFDMAKFNISLGSNLINYGTFRITNKTDNRGETEKSKITVSVPIENRGTLFIDNTNFDVSNDSDTIINKGILDVNNSIIHSVSGYAINHTVCEEDDECQNTSGTIILSSTAKIDSDNQYAIGNFTDDLKLNNGKVYGLYNEGNATLTGSVELISYFGWM